MDKSDTRIPLSCFIVACNEEERIARTIRSVIDWVDEVILVDSGSTDKTRDIASQLGATTVFNAWSGYGPQKRFGEKLCRNDWVLNLDADEVVTPELQKEIISLFADFEKQHTQPDQRPVGYHLRVVDILPDRKKPLPLARKYNIVRLYNQRIVRYSDSPVHDRVETAGQPLGQIHGLVYHYSFRSLSQAIIKLNSYSDLQAETLKQRPGWALRLRLLTEFPLGFLRFYFLRGYFMGGSTGLSYAMITASFRFFRVAKMLEKAKKQQRNG